MKVILVLSLMVNGQLLDWQYNMSNWSQCLKVAKVREAEGFIARCEQEISTPTKLLK